MAGWNETHCSECGITLGRPNYRDTSNGTKIMCCFCADRYDNIDWAKLARKREDVIKRMQQEALR